MSPLAFDKQGKPFSWHTRTAKLRVRLFRSPSSRGTCSQVLDSAGNPQFVDANIDYPEFRRVVGNVPASVMPRKMPAFFVRIGINC